ncbi:MAG TPA: septation protein A [Gammaproteobacteria bacterium]|nr:septation protein A [Gammaproteobacteria bacterium]
MKLLFDFFPILLFFAAYQLYDIYVATVVAMVASVAQVAWSWFRHRKVENMHWITMALILVLGGATLILQDEMFIKWKPTVVNWLFAIAFLASQYIGGRPIIQRVMAANISLPQNIWTRLNMIWIAFFVALGVINLFVVYNFDTDTWVNFKLFGMLALTLIFILLQGVYLARHIQEGES